MKNQDKIELCNNHIDNQNFEEAKKILIDLDKKENITDYLWALYYDNEKNEDYSEYKAKKYFGKIYDRGKATEYVFLRLSYLTDYKHHRMNILNKGLEKFPNSEILYYWLIKETDFKERDILFEKLAKNEISSLDIDLLKIDTYNTNENYQELLTILPKVHDILEFKDFNMFLQGVALYELEKYEKAKIIFEELIKNDIQHHLEVAPYYLLMLCFIKINKMEEAVKIFNLTEKMTDLDYFVYGSNYSTGIVYNCYVEDVLHSLEKIKDKKIRGNIKLIKVLYFYKIKDIFRLRDTQSVFKIYPDNLELCKMLIEYYEKKKRYIDAYNSLITWLMNINSWDYEEKLDGYFYEFDFIIKSTDEVFNEIIILIKRFLNEENYYQSKISQILLNPIIERLYQEKKYHRVIEVSKLFSIENIEVAEILFEVAYSYNEIGNINKSEEFYLQLLEKNSTSATLNNLGVIYENKKEFSKAKEYFNKALEYSANDELYNRNKQRMANKIQEEWENKLEYIGENITLESFENIGYNKQLIEVLSKSTNVDFQYMIERDLKENAISLCTKCYKTSLIMSGSIIEAFLFNKIHNLGLERYEMENGRNKRIDQMSLNELLYVALKEDVISTQLHHLAHGIRDFRNIVHPGLEIRKKALKVNSENAHLAWTIVKKIILES